MLIDPMYYVIFYDMALPRDDEHAMKKRINYFKYIHLTEEPVEGKEVELDSVKYKIKYQSTFRIINSTDNTMFLICDVEKVKP